MVSCKKVLSLKWRRSGKLFDKVRLPEIARESGCHYIVNCTVSKPSLVEKVVRNAVLIAREIGPTYLQLYTPCILEIGKNSMEGLQEMRDSEKPAKDSHSRNISVSRQNSSWRKETPRQRKRKPPRSNWFRERRPYHHRTRGYERE